MKCQIKQWVRYCESCQKSKLQRHTKTLRNVLSSSDARFTQIHMDIVGPLPPSEGHHYLLMIINGFSRWPEAILIPDMQAKSICYAIFDTWISRFGCPSLITSDQGTQMRSSTYAEFTRMLGTEKFKTTTYHAISNGIVERFHQHLKSAIKAHENAPWSEIVPIILLGKREQQLKKIYNLLVLKLVYNTNIRLPKDMIDVSNIPFCGSNFISNLCNIMQQLNPL
ncbi:retrovirus-related Pol polyprotein from transposon 412 [Trichonephila clavipes]|nr:retrovirus-related Pol polyprotein from transposon 412 [Trichonephila clavipes]